MKEGMIMEKKQKKVILFLLVLIIVLILISGIIFIFNYNNNNNLPKPEVSSGVRGEFGIDKNINEKTIDDCQVIDQ